MPRREFLYDIKFWEARRIIRGYRKRGRIFMQLLAENVYASTSPSVAVRAEQSKICSPAYSKTTGTWGQE